MYKEPHLQKKSNECAKLWREWFDVKYNQKDTDRATELRQQWCKCCLELGEMVSQELKTNPRYIGVELFPGKKQPPR